MEGVRFIMKEARLTIQFIKLITQRPQLMDISTVQFKQIERGEHMSLIH